MSLANSTRVKRQAQAVASASQPVKLEGEWPASNVRFGFSFDAKYHRSLASKGLRPQAKKGCGANASKPCGCAGAEKKPCGCSDSSAAKSKGSACCSDCAQGGAVELDGNWPFSDEPGGFSFDGIFHSRLAIKGLGVFVPLSGDAPHLLEADIEADRRAQASIASTRATLKTTGVRVNPAEQRKVVRREARNGEAGALLARNVHGLSSLDSIVGRSNGAPSLDSIVFSAHGGAVRGTEALLPRTDNKANVALSLVRGGQGATSENLFFQSSLAGDELHNASIGATVAPSLHTFGHGPMSGKHALKDAIVAAGLGLRPFRDGDEDISKTPKGLTPLVPKGRTRQSIVDVKPVLDGGEIVMKPAVTPSTFLPMSLQDQIGNAGDFAGGLRGWSRFPSMPGQISGDLTRVPHPSLSDLSSISGPNKTSDGRTGGVGFAALQGIERNLLYKLVKTARAYRSDDYAVWDLAWTARQADGDLHTAVPPSPRLIRAIIAGARQFDGTERRNLEGLSDAIAVLRGAQRDVRRSMLTPEDQRAEDSLALDAKLIQALIRETRKEVRPQITVDGVAPRAPDRGFAEILAAALSSRSKVRPWPIAPADHAYVAAVIQATRRAENPYDEASVANDAKARFTTQLLAGAGLLVPIGETSHFVEQPLFDAVVDAALQLMPSDWLQLAAVYRDEMRSCETEGSRRQSICRRGAWDRYQAAIQFYVYKTVSVVWDRALSLRGARWDLPWPPSPLPDRRLLQSLTIAIWNNHYVASRIVQGVEADAERMEIRRLLLLAALEQLGRVEHEKRDGENIAIVRLPYADVAFWVTVAAYIVAAAAVGTIAALGIVAYCGGIGKQFCVSVGDFFAGLFDGDQPNEPMQAPRSPPNDGRGTDDGHDDPDEMPTPPEPGGGTGPKPPSNDIPSPGAPKPKPMPPDVDTGPVFWNGNLFINGGAQAPAKTSVKPDVRPRPPDRIPPKPAGWDIDFVVSLCGKSASVMNSHGFGLTEMLWMMESESGLRPDVSNPPRSDIDSGKKVPTGGTVIGINQMSITNIRDYYPGFYVSNLSNLEIYNEYINWSRADQLSVAIEFFGAILNGLHVGSYSQKRRAAILHYFNAGGNAHSKAEFNMGVWHPEWRVWVDRNDPDPNKQTNNDRANIGFTYWRRNEKPYDSAYWDSTQVVTLGDLYHAMDKVSGSSQVQAVLDALGCQESL